MTRIVAGEWKGHPLPKLKTGSVRPTTDRARTILFDTLGSVEGFEVLDLYSGTGALGFEALSRGAITLISVDMDRQYIQKQKRWIQEHDAADQVRLLSGKLPGALRRIQGEFDLILADPPYTKHIATEILAFVQDKLVSEGIFVYECDRRSESDLNYPGLVLFKEKLVAETRIQIYKADQK